MKPKNLKQGRKEFDARMHRIASAQSGFSRNAVQAKGQRPFLAALGGFLWFYAIIRVANSRDVIEASLNRGTLGDEIVTYILYFVMAVIVGSVVAAIYLCGRAVVNHPKRRTARGLLTGVIAATAYCYTPASVYSFGYDLLDENTKTAIASTGLSVSSLDLSGVQAVSSWVPEITGEAED